MSGGSGHSSKPLDSVLSSRRNSSDSDSDNESETNLSEHADHGYRGRRASNDSDSPQTSMQSESRTAEPRQHQHHEDPPVEGRRRTPSLKFWNRSTDPEEAAQGSRFPRMLSLDRTVGGLLSRRSSGPEISRRAKSEDRKSCSATVTPKEGPTRKTSDMEARARTFEDTGNCQPAGPKALGTSQGQGQVSCGAIMSQAVIEYRQSPLVGSWRSDVAENWDELLKMAGVGTIARRVCIAMVSYEYITVSCDNKWQIKMNNALTSFESNFFLEQFYEEENFDGKKCRAYATLSANGCVLSIKQTALEKDGLAYLLVREVQDENHFLATVTCMTSGVVAKKYFYRIPNGHKGVP